MTRLPSGRLSRHALIIPLYIVMAIIVVRTVAHFVAPGSTTINVTPQGTTTTHTHLAILPGWALAALVATLLFAIPALLAELALRRSR